MTVRPTNDVFLLKCMCTSWSGECMVCYLIIDNFLNCSFPKAFMSSSQQTKKDYKEKNENKSGQSWNKILLTLSSYQTNNFIEKRVKRIVNLFKSNTKSTLIFGLKDHDHWEYLNAQRSVSKSFRQLVIKGNLRMSFIFSVYWTYHMDLM